MKFRSTPGVLAGKSIRLSNLHSYSQSLKRSNNKKKELKNEIKPNEMPTDLYLKIYTYKEIV